jgi:hypothetical protein
MRYLKQTWSPETAGVEDAVLERIDSLLRDQVRKGMRHPNDRGETSEKVKKRRRQPEDRGAATPARGI